MNAIAKKVSFLIFVIYIELEINKEAVGTSLRSLDYSHQLEKPVHGNPPKENEVNWKSRKIHFSPTLTMNSDGKCLQF